jgi:hypothetical protein
LTPPLQDYNLQADSVEGVPMEVPVRNAGSRVAPLVAAAALSILALVLVSCASVAGLDSRASLDAPGVKFSNGQIFLVLVDEDGMPMVRTRVDFAWESPEYYKTSAFTDDIGRVTFKGVPEVAEVTINHPGGMYQRTLIVPQQGVSELRVTLDTYGNNRVMRAQPETGTTPRE